MSARRCCLPMLVTAGTHYEVGYNIGLTFQLLIQNFLRSLAFLQNQYIPFYYSETGKKIYNGYLKSCEQIFPQYVKELKGIANGAKVPFHELFLLHLAGEIDTFLGGTDFGCTTVIVNSTNQLLIGHNEDAFIEAQDAYMVQARIKDEIGDGRVSKEEWISYCYPGHLAGFTMGTNSSGLVYGINILYPKNFIHNRIPSQFLTRAILSATDIVQLEEILRNKGCGCAAGFSVNVGFLDYPEKVLWNFEIGPCPEKSESLLHKVKVVEDDSNNDNSKPSGLFVHYNKYNFLNVEIMDKSSSEHREAVIKNMNESKDLQGVLNILGNTSDKKYPVYRDGVPPDVSATLATGVFDLMKRTWSIYIGNPIIHKDPLFVIPLMTKMKE